MKKLSNQFTGQRDGSVINVHVHAIKFSESQEILYFL